MYNVVYYISFTAGIALLGFKLSSSEIFTVSAMMVMAAMLPVALTLLYAPELPPPRRISLPRLFAIAPLALVGSFTAGLLMNGFFYHGFGVLLKQGFDVRQISFYLMIAMMMGFAVQLPVAKLSDRYGRRAAILACSLVSFAGAAAGIGMMLAGIGGV